jgi:hypothetical protein
MNWVELDYESGKEVIPLLVQSNQKLLAPSSP